ncbi:aspartate/glutamate racemase family protein [Glaciecola sp. MH2013]|uniref:aspartate/glutamate racemase family protein n=1 Tax=Glaciecola sp. MH2013 TaxID=2785524 RepID=UPI001E5E2BD7|nr:amino acid racemase [Glaciecola sp. MH2013]
MKTIGILGGMSNQATAEYYRMLNEKVNARLGGWEIAETLILGLNFGNIEYYVRNGAWDEARVYLEGKVLNAYEGGADILVCVSNTMHRVLDRVEDLVPIPFIHISDPTGAEISRQGLKKVGILGTKPVMEADYIKSRFMDKFGIELISPSEEDQVIVDAIIFNELVRGDIQHSSKEAYVEISRKLLKQGAEGIILGCTEIFLLLKPEDLPEAPLFNTTELHVDAIVDLALKQVN